MTWLQDKELCTIICTQNRDGSSAGGLQPSRDLSCLAIPAIPAPRLKARGAYRRLFLSQTPALPVRVSGSCREHLQPRRRPPVELPTDPRPLRL